MKIFSYFKRKPDHYWNYRIISRLHENPDKTKTRLFNIAEVHYENGKPSCYGDKNILKDFENIKELKWIYKHIKTAFRKPILDEDNWSSILNE